MIDVPQALMDAFVLWDRNGRQPQPAFVWKRAAWERWLPESVDALGQVPNPIDRSSVTPFFVDIRDDESAVDAYLASYIWGFARANFGPYRAARVLASNASFPADILELARIAAADGGVAAYQHVVVRNKRDSRFFYHWGPAFATKFIYFSTKASPLVDTTTVLDSYVVRWFSRNVGDAKPLELHWGSSDSYQRYVAHIASWGEALSIEVDDVERLIFADR